jgi:hypothetical protein
MALSPYTRRKSVDSTAYTTVSMVRSIELMLGIPPMNRFDGTTEPLSDCFMETPDTSSYTAVPNQVRLDDMNRSALALWGKERYWAKVSDSLDWTGIDRADPDKLDQVVWHSVMGVNTPYPVLRARAHKPSQERDSDG